MKCYFQEVCNPNPAVIVRCICEATTETGSLTSNAQHVHLKLKLIIKSKSDPSGMSCPQALDILNISVTYQSIGLKKKQKKTAKCGL